MKREEYISIITAQLGAPILDIELTDADIGKIIDVAFKELNNYIDTTYFETVTYTGPCIDVSKLKVKAVLYVTRGTLTTNNANFTNSNQLLFGTNYLITNKYSTMNGYKGTTSNLMSGYITSLLYQQIRNTIEQDLDFTFDKRSQKLYLVQQIPASNQITIVYNKILENVEEIEDEYWINYMIRLGLAYVKQTLGRIRSKYKMTSAPYELDGDTLLNEAQSELSEIREFLRSNDNLIFPID